MHVEETFVVARPPDVVFDYVTNPALEAGDALLERLGRGGVG